MRTSAEWDDAKPGFVEIDLVGHEGGNSQGEFCFTLDITDIATGWTETVSVRNKAQKWVFAAIKEATAKFPFPVLGIDSDNGSEFINWGLFRWCEQEKRGNRVRIDRPYGIDTKPVGNRYRSRRSAPNHLMRCHTLRLTDITPVRSGAACPVLMKLATPTWGLPCKVRQILALPSHLSRQFCRLLDGPGRGPRPRNLHPHFERHPSRTICPPPRTARADQPAHRRRDPAPAGSGTGETGSRPGAGGPVKEAPKAPHLSGG